MDAKHTSSRIVFLSFADKRYAGALNSLKECTGAALAIGGGKHT